RAVFRGLDVVLAPGEGLPAERLFAPALLGARGLLRARLPAPGEPGSVPPRALPARPASVPVRRLQLPNRAPHALPALRRPGGLLRHTDGARVQHGAERHDGEEVTRPTGPQLCRRASIGSSRDARCAGYQPNSTPT